MHLPVFCAYELVISVVHLCVIKKSRGVCGKCSILSWKIHSNCINSILLYNLTDLRKGSRDVNTHMGYKVLAYLRA